MNIDKINFNIPFNKSDGCVIINAKEWDDNSSRLIQAYNMKGEKSISNINTVLKTNYNKDIYGEVIKEGNKVLITRQASRISYLSPYKIKGLEGYYANVHLLQIIGYFEDGVVSLDTLTPIYNKVIMEKVQIPNDTLLYRIVDDNFIVGKIVKLGTNSYDKDWNKIPMQVSLGQTVLFRDNVTTNITLGDKDIMATEEHMCVGYFEDDIITLDNLKLFSDNILLEKYDTDNVDGSSLLYKGATISDDISDVTEFYNEDRFRVVKVGTKIKGIKEGDKVVVQPDFLNYVTFNGVKYYLLNSIKYINAKFE